MPSAPRTILGALAVTVLSVAAVHAQTPGSRAPADLPRLTQLGPLPTGVPKVSLLADGSLFDAGGAPLASAAVAVAVPSGRDAPELVMRVERTTPAAAVVALLTVARAHGVGVVHFAATLPDGSDGGFALALPPEPRPTTTVHLRAHRERPGIPPSSVTPLLRRLRAGSPTATFVLGVEVPGDASCEQMLRILSAVAEARVPWVAVSCALTSTQRELASTVSDLRTMANAAPIDGATMAMDLSPFPRTQVPAAARPQAPPRLRDGLFGCFEPWQDSRSSTTPNREDGAARGPRGRAAAVEHGSSWLLRQQRSDGGFGGAGDDAVLEATSLMTLMMLGEGQTVDGDGRAEALRRSVGWLLGQQSLDHGRFGDDIPGSVRRHALATYAMTEAAGASPRGRLLRGSAQAALEWLCAQRRPDGGFGDGIPDAPSDTETTAWCHAAIASAESFEFRPRVSLSEASAWFDLVAAPAGEWRPRPNAPATSLAGAAALSSVLRAGLMAPQGAADHLLATADVDDPWCAYWATEAMYRHGGAPWDAWSRKLTAVVATQVNEGDEKGTWDPVGADSRVVTSAVRVLTLQMYYRYSRLVR